MSEADTRETGNASKGDDATPARWFRDPDVRIGAVLVVLTLAHVAYYFPRTVDDLFISLRYAENLAAGRGAVYNVGERVEGYSSPGWLFVQTLGFLLHLEPVTFGKVVGVGCLLASAFGLRAVVRELYGVTGWPAWIPAFACVVNPYLVAWTVLGLETPLHIAAIVLAPLAIHRALAAAPAAPPARRSLAFAAGALVLLGLSRPESALYIAANVLGPLAAARKRVELAPLARRLAPFVVPAGVILAALLLVRRAYYGDFLPNTYQVKGAHASFDLGKLEPLWAQGAPTLEAVVYIAGGLALVVYGWRTRQIALPLTFLLCLYFTASVAIDWMPSLRHLLPVTVLAPVGWSCLVSDLRLVSNEEEAPPGSLAASLGQKMATRLLVVAIPIMFATASHLLTVDVRLSVLEHKDKWVTRKAMAKWHDTWDAYRRVEPAHVTKMDAYEMGQISQAWGVLEASDEPVEDSWFAGRDIGAVGYYTGVRVFDTAGLVTREVSRSIAWAAHGQVTDDLVKQMMAKRPLAAEIYDGWDVTLGRNRVLLEGYRIRSGSRETPGAFIAVDRPPPSQEKIVARYRAFVAKFPRAYHLHTLYGEAVGAAVERRLRTVEAGTNAPAYPQKK